MPSVRLLLTILLGAFAVLAEASRRQLAEYYDENGISFPDAEPSDTHDALPNPPVASGDKVAFVSKSLLVTSLIIGSAADDSCGSHVTNVGDFNNDGHADFAIGCHLADKHHKINNGQVMVFLSHGEWPKSTDLAKYTAGILNFP